MSRTEIEARISSHMDELLELWQVEQGVTKHRDLQLIASVLPFPRNRPVRVLDLCCGPGGLYEKLGFHALSKPQSWMERDG